jgi:hypothetical protein
MVKKCFYLLRKALFFVIQWYGNNFKQGVVQKGMKKNLQRQKYTAKP